MNAALLPLISDTSHSYSPLLLNSALYILHKGRSLVLEKIGVILFAELLPFVVCLRPDTCKGRSLVLTEIGLILFAAQVVNVCTSRG